MNQAAIFSPVFVLLLLTLFVWIYMYAKRIPFIQNSGLTPDQLSPNEFAKISPPDVSNPSDNLKNLFELPVVFYFLATYLFVTAQVDSTYLIAAWIFVALRILHSAVHATVNIIMLRFFLYLGSAVALWFMVCRAGLNHFF